MNPFWTGFVVGVFGLAAILALPIYVIRCMMLAAISDANEYRRLFEQLRDACRTETASGSPPIQIKANAS